MQYYLIINTVMQNLPAQKFYPLIFQVVIYGKPYIFIIKILYMKFAQSICTSSYQFKSYIIEVMLCCWKVLNTTKKYIKRLHSDLAFPQCNGKQKSLVVFKILLELVVMMMMIMVVVCPGNHSWALSLYLIKTLLTTQLLFWFWGVFATWYISIYTYIL